ncbi:TetR/AcrR family transcriptional regulator [Luteolibacter pohnpeiensis]|uniref:TetR/AcrR family transcriptional regulator n=1 Tax=Luteolibacter pohnpeiensis TaxID=454153 RepID=A0A934SAY0_9BACT|nr:TetR/AcrR family transcriptional regulator [Luteolibacter pohnpeiensis]MBK1884146.1 TetR/AcrR family transcriptional regulator [Luteolibacter pohnpeiensis]
MGQLRERKKQETRQRISDVATRLFFEHGFDAVTVDEIAIAANVSKMTVFNYFSRKEELILDREGDLKLLPFLQALSNRPDAQSPFDTIRTLLQEMFDEKHPLCYINSRTATWWRFVSASPALRSRLRELAEEAAEALAIELGGPKPDGMARLTAGMIVLTVNTAREEAIRVFEYSKSSKKASAAFLDLIQKGLLAIEQMH